MKALTNLVNTLIIKLRQLDLNSRRGDDDPHLPARKAERRR